MKRVVNTLLQLFDYLPENTIVIAATNQLQMIDDALKRRFDLSLELKAPGKDEVKALVNLTIGDKFVFDDETVKAEAMDLCIGLSYYVIKRTLLTSIKRTILDKGITDKIESEKWLELIRNEKKESK
jgi:AAA+ superfamily predicted ATPase